MAEDSRLAWVQRNCHKPRAVHGLGGLMQDLAGRIEQASAPGLDEVVETLAKLVDEKFRRHCRVVSLWHGRLTIAVEHHALAYGLKVRWQRELLRKLPGACRTVPVSAVVFTVGQEGLAIPGPDSDRRSVEEGGEKMESNS